MTARASNRDVAVEAPKAWRLFAFEAEHHPGFSRNLYIRAGKLNLTLSSYAGNWYVALMWA